MKLFGVQHCCCLALALVLTGAFAATGTAQIRASAGGNQAEGLISEAVHALENGNTANAKTLVQRALAASPDNVKAHTLAGILADRENNLQIAERHFASAVKLSPQTPETHNNYGAILLKQNRLANAKREFTTSLQLNPNQQSALVNLGQIHFNEGTPEAFRSAKDLFHKAQKLAPDAEVARALVITALRLNENTEAAEYYRQYFALAGGSTNIDSSQKIKQRLQLGALLRENNLLDEARQEFEAVAALEPSNVEALVQLARVQLARKDIQAAGRTLEAAVARGIDDARIYAALADVYQAFNRFENAIPAMRLAIKKEPNNELYRARYGLLLVDAKAPAAAVIRLDEAVKEFPTSARLWLALGIAYTDDNKTIEARSAFEKALAIDPKLVPALAYLAMSFSEEAKYEEAAKIYERALSLDEKNAVLHYLLADTLLKSTNPDLIRIEKALKRSVTLDAGLASAHLALGRLYVRQNRLVEALGSLESAVKLKPELIEALYQLGRVYARLKRNEESQRTLAKFKQLNDLKTEQKDIDRRELVRRLASVRF
ncbi:MAG TPA: tetratricopeptide repeat protein [Pyrinomonadaceae bacterium]